MPTRQTDPHDEASLALQGDDALRDAATEVEEMEPSAAAVLFAAMPPEDAADLAEYLDPRTAAAVMVKMNAIDAAAIIKDMHAAEGSVVLSEMNPDDRVDVLEHLPEALRGELVAELPAAEAAEVRNLEQYPPDTAGGIMTTAVTALSQDLTVEQAVNELRRLHEQLEQMYYVYVVDSGNRLIGVVSMRDLILAPAQTPLHRVMSRDVAQVPATLDQEQVARLMSERDFMALPVVDADTRLIGIITFDDVVDVAEEEATEDIHKLGGLQALDAPYTSVSLWTMFRKRGLWLSVLFLGQMLTATVMERFESSLEQALVLTLFIPLIISSGGNSGSQATTLIIRALALGEVHLRDWWTVLRREVICSLLLGLWLGLIGLARVHLWHVMGWQDYTAYALRVAVTVGLTLVGVVLWGSLVGSMLPFLLRRVGLDPATSSAPFVATLVDVTGLIIYFTIAILVLSGTLL